MQQFEQDIINCMEVMKSGGVILYPTDTVWGIGCDATNTDAVKKVYNIKRREDSKSMIVLMGDEKEILQYVAAPDLAVFDFLEEQKRPTTVIFDGAIGLPDNLVAADGSIAIRMANDDFCRHLIKRFRKPVVSTSANISGEATAKNFKEVSEEIKNQMDYVVQWRQDDESQSLPSQIIKFKGGEAEWIRK